MDEFYLSLLTIYLSSLAQTYTDTQNLTLNISLYSDRFSNKSTEATARVGHDVLQYSKPDFTLFILKSPIGNKVLESKIVGVAFIFIFIPSSSIEMKDTASVVFSIRDGTHVSSGVLQRVSSVTMASLLTQNRQTA